MNLDSLITTFDNLSSIYSKKEKHKWYKTKAYPHYSTQTQCWSVRKLNFFQRGLCMLQVKCQNTTNNVLSHKVRAYESQVDQTLKIAIARSWKQIYLGINLKWTNDLKFNDFDDTNTDPKTILQYALNLKEKPCELEVSDVIDALFSIIHGDHTGSIIVKKTHTRTLLQYLSKTFPDNKFGLADLSKHHNTFQNLIGLSDYSFMNLARAYRQYVMDILTGSSTIAIFSGYTNEPGHSILIELKVFTENNERKVSGQIINTGEGLDYHTTSITFHNKEINLKPMSLVTLENSFFLLILFELKFKHRKEFNHVSKNTNYTIHDFYVILLDCWPGGHETNLEGEGYKEQYTNTCMYKPIEKLIKKRAGKLQGKIALLEARCDILEKFQKGMHYLNMHDKWTVQDCVEHTQRKIVKLKSFSELSVIDEKTIKAIQLRLNVVQKKTLKMKEFESTYTLFGVDQIRAHLQRITTGKINCQYNEENSRMEFQFEEYDFKFRKKCANTKNIIINTSSNKDFYPYEHYIQFQDRVVIPMWQIEDERPKFLEKPTIKTKSTPKADLLRYEINKDHEVLIPNSDKHLLYFIYLNWKSGNYDTAIKWLKHRDALNPKLDESGKKIISWFIPPNQELSRLHPAGLAISLRLLTELCEDPESEISALLESTTNRLFLCLYYYFLQYNNSLKYKLNDDVLKKLIFISIQSKNIHNTYYSLFMDWAEKLNIKEKCLDLYNKSEAATKKEVVPLLPPQPKTVPFSWITESMVNIMKARLNNPIPIVSLTRPGDEFIYNFLYNYSVVRNDKSSKDLIDFFIDHLNACRTDTDLKIKELHAVLHKVYSQQQAYPTIEQILLRLKTESLASILQKLSDDL